MPRAPLALTAAVMLFAAPALAAPLEAYGKLPRIEQAEVSPDGALLALAITNGEQREVVVQDLATKKFIDGLKAGDSKVRDIRWAGSNHLLLTISATANVAGVISPKSEWRMVVDYDVKRHKQRQLLTDTYAQRERMNVVEGSPTVRIIGGKPYAFVQGVDFVDSQGVSSLFRVDLDAGASVLRNEAIKTTDQWLVGEDGETLAETRYDPNSGRWTLSLKRDGVWRVAKTAVDPIGHPVIAGLGRDGHAVVIDEMVGDQEQTREFDPGASDWSAPTPLRAGEDQIYDPITDRPIGAHRLVGDIDSYSFYAPLDQTIWDATVTAFPGEAVSLDSMSQDHRKLVVTVDSPTLGPCFYLVDIGANSAKVIGAGYDELTPSDIGEARPVAFKAADGLALTGYLTLPRGSDAKKLPLIVFPHGGPAARDEPGFNWWAQAMASRGYAVLQVNYRGSEGFGLDFLRAGFGEWGVKMQTDLSDGVRYLAAQGTIDPKRVCIVGASYGGYAALAGATLDTGVYRCAVDVSGPSELRRFVDWAKDQSDVTAQRYWDRFMGAKTANDSHLQDISPADHADRVTIPILIIHGKDDTVVPFAQSTLMADALKRAGKPYDFVTLSHEDHWLSRGETRLQMLKATMDFVEKNNPPG